MIGRDAQDGPDHWRPVQLLRHIRQCNADVDGQQRLHDVSQASYLDLYGFRPFSMLSAGPA
jgi:hypothetical protein